MRAAAVLAIIVANVLGGLSYHWSIRAMECGLEPGMVSAIRSICAVLVLGPWVAMTTGWRMRYTRAEWVRLLIIGIVATGFPLVLGIIGVRMSTPSNASILTLLEPASILLFSWLLLRERIRPTQIIGLLIGLAGAYLVLIGNVTSWNSLLPRDLMESQHARGNMILIVHAVLWGIYSPVIKPLANRHRAIDLAFIIMLFSLVPMLPLAGYEMKTWSRGPDFAQAVKYAVLLGVLVSVFATILWNFSLQHLRASTMAPFVFLQPLVGCVMDVFVRDKPLTTGAIYGGVAICLAVILVTYTGRSASTPVEVAS